VGEREFVTYFDALNRYRHWHVRERGKIVEFRIQYETLIADNWHPVVRYDSAQGQPHRDIIHPDGTQTKEWYRGFSNAEVLALGQHDIMRNWGDYCATYEKEMS
jgi:hypothetical protein